MGDTLNDIQGDFHVTEADSILEWSVWINGPAAGGWSNDGGDWGLGLQGNLDKKMYDDGTHGDRVANDSVFTTQIQTHPDSVGVGTLGQIGQVYKFGIYGGDNEGGKGGFGNNHVANIDDSGPEFTIYTQFGSINPAFYDAWNYDEMKPVVTGVHLADNLIPETYKLGHNYPNPFNPETTFKYSLPKKTHVSIKIYNIFGQVVATIKEGEQPAGNYSAIWDGRNDFGQLVSSGVYLYEMRTSDFRRALKMSLLK